MWEAFYLDGYIPAPGPGKRSLPEPAGTGGTMNLYKHNKILILDELVQMPKVLVQVQN